jgi:Na+/proline symporter
MIGSLMAAYFSTMSTHLNWGASYVVHDFYQRFVRPNVSEKHYVFVSRIVTALLMLVAAGIVFFLETAKQSFDLLLSIGAGTGLIYLLRWYWWRINAWSEISAMISSFVISAGLFVGRKMAVPGIADLSTHLTLAVSVGFTTVVWFVVTFLTRPTDHGVLLRFYRLTRPFGPGWKHIQREANVGPSPDSVPLALLGWVLAVLMVYSALFGTGSFLYGNMGMGTVFLVLFLVSAIGLAMILGKIFGKPMTPPEAQAASREDALEPDGCGRSPNH